MIHKESTNQKMYSKKQKTGKSYCGEHANNAERFITMCNTLDRISTMYKRIVPKNQSQKQYPDTNTREPYLVTHLTYWVSQYIEQDEYKTRTGEIHQVMKCSGDGRRTIPSTICEAIKKLDNPLWGCSKDQKVRITWIVCYLHNIQPNTTTNQWQAFDCSHRCICYNLDGYTCIDPKCLIWESKSYNQSRGNHYCCNPCTHFEECGKTICSCNEIHIPSCC